MKPQIAIIADDLTGAGDSAVQFVRCGWETQLYVGGSEEAFALGDMQAQVVSVNSNSRAMAPQAAAQAVAREMQTFRKHGVRHVFKKVDSTLRGAFAAEIEAAVSNGMRMRSPWCARPIRPPAEHWKMVFCWSTAPR